MANQLVKHINATRADVIMYVNTKFDQLLDLVLKQLPADTPPEDSPPAVTLPQPPPACHDGPTKGPECCADQDVAAKPENSALEELVSKLELEGKEALSLAKSNDYNDFAMKIMELDELISQIPKAETNLVNVWTEKVAGFWSKFTDGPDEKSASTSSSVSSKNQSFDDASSEDEVSLSLEFKPAPNVDAVVNDNKDFNLAPVRVTVNKGCSKQPVESNKPIGGAGDSPNDLFSPALQRDVDSLVVLRDNAEKLDSELAKCSVSTSKANKDTKDDSILQNQREIMFGRNLECTFKGCDKWLPNRIQLEAHLRSDHQVHPLTCLVDKCGVRFGIRSQLEDHILHVHTAPTEFCCRECNKQFADYCQLETHFLAMHEAGEFVCIKCCVVGFTRAQVFEHYEKDHSK